MTGSDWYDKLGFEPDVDNVLNIIHNGASPFDFA
jgi:hypothetical protein